MPQYCIQTCGELTPSNMAKVVNNIITEGLSGAVAESRYTFRQVGGKTYLVRKSISTAPVTEAQLAGRTLFAEAARAARADMADAGQAAHWADVARASKRYSTAYGAAMAHHYALLAQQG